MRMFRSVALAVTLAIGASTITAVQAQDKGLDNHVKLDPYYSGLKGKKGRVRALGHGL